MPAGCQPRWIVPPSRTITISITIPFFSGDSWTVIQQGMNEINRYARRYHWLGEVVSSFVNEPHSSILSETREQALNLVASESDPARYSFAHSDKEGIKVNMYNTAGHFFLG